MVGGFGLIRGDRSELCYQQHPPQPRPTTLLLAGRRVGLFRCQGCTVGLAPVKELYPYKRDVSSNEDQSLSTRPRLTHPSRNSLLAKIDEQDMALDSLYRPITSGHLEKNGWHISGHSKSDEDDDKRTIIDRGHLRTNEFIITGYRKRHYRCLLITLDQDIDSLSAQLKDKFTLEQELSLAELPLVFYEPRSGGIRDIIFASEYGVTSHSLPKLQRTADTLTQFAEYAGTPALWSVITLLPPARVLAFLSNPSAALTQGTWQLEQNTRYRDELRQAVERGDSAMVDLYRQRGANLMAAYPAPCFYLTDSPLRNLLDILVRAPGLGARAIETHQEQPDGLAGWTQVGKLLYDHGCRVPIDERLITRLPTLAAYMIKQGECCQEIPSMEDLFQLLFRYRAVGVINEADCETLINGVQRLFSCPSQLDNGYTRYLNTTLRIKPLGWVTDEFPDISRPKNYDPCSFAEQFPAVAPASGPLWRYRRYQTTEKRYVPVCTVREK